MQGGVLSRKGVEAWVGIIGSKVDAEAALRLYRSTKEKGKNTASIETTLKEFRRLEARFRERLDFAKGHLSEQDQKLMDGMVRDRERTLKMSYELRTGKKLKTMAARFWEAQTDDEEEVAAAEEDPVAADEYDSDLDSGRPLFNTKIKR